MQLLESSSVAEGSATCEKLGMLTGLQLRSDVESSDLMQSEKVVELFEWGDNWCVGDCGITFSQSTEHEMSSESWLCMLTDKLRVDIELGISVFSTTEVELFG